MTNLYSLLFFMPKQKEVIPQWTIFWMIKILYEEEQVWYKRFFTWTCLNCWERCTKNLKDLKKENRPRTCGSCKFRKDAVIAIPWEMYGWAKFIKELPVQNWNRRALVLDRDWIEKSLPLHSLVTWNLRKEIDTRTKHWMHTERFYKIYRWILQRCNNSNNHRFNSYGWRWIKCLWESFESFKEDMYESYLKHLDACWDTSIDRINVNWDYEKWNCRWATKTVQSNNMRRNIIVPKEFWNKTLMEICKEYEISRTTLYGRIKRWHSFQEAIVHERGKHFKKTV